MSEFDFSNREMVLQKLKELKERNIPKMSLEKLLQIDGCKWLQPYADKATEEEKQKADEELSKYCERGYNENKDIFSDEECCFYWGLRHGEMVTDDNGMNRTFYHYLTLAGEKHRVEMLLQYHPDCYEIDESEGENENNN